MDDLPKLEPNFKYTPHMVLLGIIFSFQYFSKSKELSLKMDPDQKKKADKIFWIYIVIYQISKAADWCTGPYMFEFYERYHRFSIEMIAKYVAISFIASLFLGTLLVGYLNDKSDRKFPCILYGIFLGLSCLVRMIQHPVAVLFTQIFFGMASSVLYSSFENWFVAECNRTITDKDVRDTTLACAFEKSAVIDSMCAVTVSGVSGIAKRAFGIQAPYIVSTFLCVVSVVLSIIFLTSIPNQKEEESMHEITDVMRNVGECISACAKKPFIILIGLTESLLFAILHIFIFAWTPTLKELNPDADTGEVFTLFMMAYMVGGSSFRALYFYFNSDTFKVAKIVSFLSLVAFLVSWLNISYKITLYGFICYEVSVGLFYPVYSKIKSEYLPDNIRGTLMTMFKVPFNIIVTILLISMNKLFTLHQLIFLCLAFAAFVFIVHWCSFYQNDFEILTAKIEEKAKLKNK